MRHSNFTVVYDACVLYPAPLRDFLMWLGLSGRFRARWSSQIHDEWRRSLLRDRPDLTVEQLNRTSDLMDQAIPDALVVGHEAIAENLHLPDPDDRHVLAAAIRCGASVVSVAGSDSYCSAPQSRPLPPLGALDGHLASISLFCLVAPQSRIKILLDVR